jgi:predicted RecB family nuclease
MRIESNSVWLSATDLSNHLACRHLTSLDLSVAAGMRAEPTWRSPDLWVLRQLGFEHEAAYVRQLAGSGLAVVDLRATAPEQAFAQSVAAMERGAEIIVQATLADGRWLGRADILRRVNRPSKFGSWSYEAYDCKLAMDTKAGTILQLSLYSELIAAVQGIWPEAMYVVPPHEGLTAETYRVSDFAAYYRYVKRRLEAAVENHGREGNSYPEPTAHCAVCRWWAECDGRWHADDHLSLVAGISKMQERQLVGWDVRTMTNLAGITLPLQRRPERGSGEGYVRVREQARVQVEGRSRGIPFFEILRLDEDHGLHRLPEPSAGDLFLDLEGDPFVGRGGREYLFGVASEDGHGSTDYQFQWAMTAHEEKVAFEWFVDLAMARWAENPSMHIYHFGGYESGALKRLMGRHATREDEIDRILRARLLVDLHMIVKRTARASVEQYSLKSLEIIYAFERKTPLEDARGAMRQMQHSLELGLAGQLDNSVRDLIVSYNAEDCVSAWALRQWLEGERRKLEQEGQRVLRPTLSEGAPPESVDERQQRSAALAAALRNGLPEDASLRNSEQEACWLLSNLLDWHRRESKADWWEFFRLKYMADDELLDERGAIAGLRFVERLGVQRAIPTDRYVFDKQDTDVRAGDEVYAKGDKIGEVAALDLAARSLDIKKTKKTADFHPNAVYASDVGPSPAVLAEALLRLGAWIRDNGIDGAGPYQAARDLLLRRPPRLSEPAARLVGGGEPTVEAAKELGRKLDNSLLAIQGPPGAGKTYTGARMICELIRRGKKVGITATSHKVISNLLNEVVKAAAETGLHGLRCVQKVKKEDKPEHDPPHILMTVENKETLAAFRDGANVLAGTNWVWAQNDYFEAVDALFVDEAGQMALANVLAVAHAGKNLVLLGDPQQLDQPLKGSHPEGADLSALEYFLGDAQTMPPEMGLFLEKTWRLHPKLCEFTSEVFYEGRLFSMDGLDQQRIEGHAWLGEHGLWFVPVSHVGNQNSSPEEVDAVVKIVDSLTRHQVHWADQKERRALTLRDVLVVAPYNAQVSDLLGRMPGARVGTVDKFQGQQAPVVIYSLTTSSPEDAPRGMEFLYSLNRLNVATSRAQAIVIIVASPRLLEPECSNPRQMRLANALCRYVELAREAKAF